MQFLKTLFWVVLAVAAVIFGMNNWTPATVGLWGGMQLEIKLPILIFGAFLLGFLPTFGYYRASRWRMRRRLDSTERALADMRGVDDETLAPTDALPGKTESPARS